MSYVLVHLVGDEASEQAGRLVDHLRDSRSPSFESRGNDPPHAEVEGALAESTEACGVCVGHGGTRGLGPTPNEIWADAEQLGHIFRDRRLYAYACDSAGGVDSLGARAVLAGVAVFVGHEGVVKAPLPPQELQMVEMVAGAAILAFIDGTDDEQALQAAIDDAGDEIIPEDIPIDFAAIGERRPNPWSQKLLFDKLALSLRVHRRAPGPAG